MSMMFKELELKVHKDRYAVSAKAIWNGGDGIDWTIERVKCYNYFARKHLTGFLHGTEIPPAPVPENMDIWIAQQLHGAIEVIEATRQDQFNCLRSRFNLPLINWGENDNLGNITPEMQSYYNQEKYNIQKEYHRELGGLNMRRVELRRDFRNAQIEYRNAMDRYDRRCIDCNNTFREVFGPAVMVHVEDLVNTNNFQLAWTNLHTIYNTSNPNLVRSSIIDRINNFRYNPGTMTVAGACQYLEENWAPLMLMPTGFSDDEKLSILYRAFSDIMEFDNVLQHCRRSQLDYEHTKSQLLSEVNYKIEKYRENELLRQRFNRDKYPVKNNRDEINVMAKIRANVKCYKCGEIGHYANECIEQTVTRKDYYDPKNSTGKPVFITERYVERKDKRNHRPNYRQNESETDRQEVSSNGSRQSGYSRSSMNSRNSKNSGKSYSSSGSNVRHGRKYANKNSSSSSLTRSNLKSRSNDNRGYKSGDEDKFINKTRISFMNKIKESQSKNKRSGTPIIDNHGCMIIDPEVTNIVEFKPPLIFSETLNKHIGLRSPKPCSDYLVNLDWQSPVRSTEYPLDVFDEIPVRSTECPVETPLGSTEYPTEIPDGSTEFPIKIPDGSTESPDEIPLRLEIFQLLSESIRNFSFEVNTKRGPRPKPYPFLCERGLTAAITSVLGESRTSYWNFLGSDCRLNMTCGEVKAHVHDDSACDRSKTEMHADATGHRKPPKCGGKICEFTISFDSKMEQMNMMTDEISNHFIESMYIKDTIIQEGNFLNNVVISDRLDSIYPKESMNEIVIIFDSGCTSHVSSYLEVFDYILDYIGNIKLPDNTICKYHGKGKVGFLNDVLWCPYVNGIYISLSKLADEGYTTIISGDKLSVYDNNKNLICEGIKKNGLYYYHENEDLIENMNEMNIDLGSAPKKSKTSIGNMNDLDYLHHRWGHPNVQCIKEALRRNTVTGTLVDPEEVRKQELTFCVDCERGKFHQLHIPKEIVSYEESGMMEFMAHDTKGPFKVQSFTGHYFYFDLFAFKKSRWLMVEFKRRKNEFYENLKNVLLEVDKFGYQVKHLQTDDDSLYRSRECKDILDEHKIFKRTSIAYHHYSNGWIERTVRTILDKARTIMLIYDCPLRFWKEAIDTAIYLYNLTPNKSLNWITPWEMVYDEKPDISHLVPFYAPGLVFIAKEDVNRLHPLSQRSYECRMLGYDKEAKNAYLVWVPALGTIKRAVNCKFQEGIDLSLRNEEDDKRDFSRFRMSITDEEDERLKERISNNINFFDDTEEPYWSLEDTLEEEEGMYNITEEFKLPNIPKTIEEALTCKEKEHWLEAMNKELDQLLEMSTFILTKPTSRENIAKMRFVFQVKLDNDFKIKYKARLVLCGYSQVYKVDYLTTYSPTIGKDSLKLCIIYILKHKMTMELYDFKSAFIEGYNDYKIIGQLPRELFPKENPNVYVEILRSLYGEKQAAYIWYTRLKEILCNLMGYENLMYDEAIFIKKNEKKEIISIIAVHVDDLLVGTYSYEDQNIFMKEIKKHVRDIKRTEKLQKYLGMEIKLINNIVHLKQEYYIKSIYDELSVDEKSIIKKRLYPGNNYVIDYINNDEVETVDLLSLIGKLRYVIDCTKIDCMASLGIISENCTKANFQQVKLAYQILSFLYTTKDYVLKLHASRDKDIKLYAFCDASHNIGNGHSRLGGVFYLTYESAPISCFSKKDIAVSNSAMEAEIRALDRTVRQIIIYRELLNELNYQQIEPTIIYTDSKASVEYFKHYRNSKKLRHIMKLIHTIRNAVNERIIKLVYIRTEYNVADILTKLTSLSSFKQLQSWILYGYNENELGKYIEYSNKLIDEPSDTEPDLHDTDED